MISDVILIHYSGCNNQSLCENLDFLLLIGAAFFYNGTHSIFGPYMIYFTTFLGLLFSNINIMLIDVFGLPQERVIYQLFVAH
jgi:hypothetical protein